jgi:Polyphosphate kinase 2 (PPK2)
MADDIIKRIAGFIEPFQVTPGSHVKLAKDFDPAFKAGIKKKKDGVGLLNDGIAILADYQAKLAAQATHGVVVVLQALDAAGKDGTIRHVMSGVNPQGVRVESFKVPSRASSTRTSYAATRSGCLHGARSESSTGPTTRRCWSSACTPRTSVARRSRLRRESTTSGRAGSKRSVTGSGTSPTTVFAL